jgi:hypothetical protein
MLLHPPTYSDSQHSLVPLPSARKTKQLYSSFDEGERVSRGQVCEALKQLGMDAKRANTYVNGFFSDSEADSQVTRASSRARTHDTHTTHAALHSTLAPRIRHPLARIRCASLQGKVSFEAFAKEYLRMQKWKSAATALQVSR